MAMINMLRSVKDMKDSGCMPCCGENEEAKPEYPYGLRLCLGKPELEKLGLTEPPAVGTEMTVRVKVKVVSASKSADEDGENADSTLQVTDMDFEQPKKPAGDVMFGGMKAKA